MQGYHQIPVKKEDRKYTSFITPFGKFMHNRLPMGYSDASNQFIIATDPLAKGIQRVEKCPEGGPYQSKKG